VAGQGFERRDMLRVLALAAAASSYPGFHRWAFACDHQASEGTVAVRPSRYTPRFFTADEYWTVDQLTSLILPSDDTPGAREAGVSEFVDFMVAHDPSLQYDFRYGLTWLDMHARALHQMPFRELTPAQQTSLLEPLASKPDPVDRAPQPLAEGRAFFERIRSYTIMGFYTSRIGLEQLGYPGLRFYSESPGCPNPEDPEHRHI
jgi:gluconate 2-dehydrogenase gamma chain